MGDMDDVIVAKSDQMNAIDLLDRTKIIRVTKRDMDKTREQPLWLFYEGDNGKPWKPCLTMRRVLRGLYGPDSQNIVGHTLQLERDGKVTWGGKAVGGIRLTHADGIDSPIDIPIQVGKGKIENYRVHPLKLEKAAAKKPPTNEPEKTNMDSKTENLPPHRVTANVIIKAMKDIKSAPELQKYWDSQEVKNDLEIIELADIRVADFVRDKYKEFISSLGD